MGKRRARGIRIFLETYRGSGQCVAQTTAGFRCSDPARVIRNGHAVCNRHAKVISLQRHPGYK